MPDRTEVGEVCVLVLGGMDALGRCRVCPRHTDKQATAMCKACHKNACPVHIWTTCLSIDELLSRSLLRSYQRHLIFLHFITSPRYIGEALFSIDFFVYMYLCFFVSNITRKRLDRFAWNFQGRYVVWSDHGTTWSHFGQFRETAQCRDSQHWSGVCCALAPQLVS